MKRSKSKAQFVLLFSYVIFIAHTLAEPSEAVKNSIIASRQRHREARLSAPNGTIAELSNNWSGAYQTNVPPSGTFDSVIATWIISSISLPQAITREGQWGISEWIGIDGQRGCNALFQAGTISYITTDDTGAVKETGTFVVYEWYPGPLVIANYTVAEGEVLEVALLAISPSEGQVVFSNPVTEQIGVYLVSAPGPDDNLCGNSVEWILELQNNGGWELPNFGQIYLQNCFAYISAGPTINLSGATLIDLVDYDDTLLGRSTLLSDTEVSVEYVV